MDITEFLRGLSNRVRTGFASIVDGSLGRTGDVGKFLGCMAGGRQDDSILIHMSLLDDRVIGDEHGVLEVLRVTHLACGFALLH